MVCDVLNAFCLFCLFLLCICSAAAEETQAGSFNNGAGKFEINILFNIFRAVGYFQIIRFHTG